MAEPAPGRRFAVPRRTPIAALLVSALAMACGPRGPREGDLQLAAWSVRLHAEATRDEVRRLASEYPLLRVQDGPAPGQVTVRTPADFFARDWLAYVEFGPDGRLLRVAHGTSDYAPLRPKYPAPSGMPADRCFAARDSCEKPWF